MEDETAGADDTSTVETAEEEIELDLGEEAEEIDWKAKAEKAEEVAKNQRIRAEKAEKAAKEAKPAETAALPTADLYALVKAGVPEEDIEEVSDYAAFKKISIAEALKAPTVKTLLAERKEARDVAEATNTSRARRQTTSASPEALLEQASKGQLPDTAEGTMRLAEARMERRKAASKH